LPHCWLTKVCFLDESFIALQVKGTSHIVPVVLVSCCISGTKDELKDGEWVDVCKEV
jgi:hypothetical protein